MLWLWGNPPRDLRMFSRRCGKGTTTNRAAIPANTLVVTHGIVEISSAWKRSEDVLVALGLRADTEDHPHGGDGFCRAAGGLTLREMTRKAVKMIACRRQCRELRRHFKRAARHVAESESDFRSSLPLEHIVAAAVEISNSILTTQYPVLLMRLDRRQDNDAAALAKRTA